MRWLFAPLVLLLVWLVAEAGAYAGLGWLDGAAFSPSHMAAERAALAAEADAPGDEQPASARPAHVIHPYLGYVGNPRYDTRADPAKYEHNEYGFPDDGSPLRTPGPDRVIVAIAGGSMALRFSHGPGMLALIQALWESPRFAGRDIELVRLAEAGYKQPQQLMALAYLLSLGAHFDVLIVLDGFNEVALHGPENRDQGVFPAFPRKWLRWVDELSDPEVLRREGEIAYLARERADWAVRFDGPLARHSPLANLVWRARDRRLAAQSFAAERWLQEWEPPEAPYRLTGPRVAFDDDELFDALVAIWQRSAQQLHHLAVGNGITYHHFLQPNQYVEGSKVLTPEEQRTAHDERHPYHPGAIAGYPKLIEGARELSDLGIPLHDLTRVFHDVDETVYVDACCHLNDRGHALLAEAMAAAMVE